MITRGLDGTFYEIPDDTADQYKVPPEEVQNKLGKGCGCLPSAPSGMGQEMMGNAPAGGSPQGVVINVINPSAVQNPMMAPQQGGPEQQQQNRSFLQGGGQEGLQEGEYIAVVLPSAHPPVSKILLDLLFKH